MTGRVLGVLISPFTTPSTLLLCSIPFSLIGSSLPILFNGEMTHTLILASAILSGLGKRHPHLLHTSLSLSPCLSLFLFHTALFTSSPL
jgi:hypothetical protein